MDRPQGLIDLDFRLRRAGLVLLWLTILAAVFYMLRQARPAVELVLTVLSPFIVAMIIAYIFNPIVTWLQRRFGFRRLPSVMLTYALILLLFAGFFAIVIPILYTQARTGITSLVTNAPRVMDRATEWLKLRVSPDEMKQAEDFVRQNLDLSVITGRAGQVTEGAMDTTRMITRIVGTTISVIIGGFAFITFVVVICFYFLLDYGRFEHIARVLLPEDTESRVFHIWRKIDVALSGYLRGQLMVAATIGTLYTVFLVILGMKEYAILIGFLAGFGNMIPYCGPLLGGIPAGLWILFGSDANFDTGQEKLIGIAVIVGFSAAVQSLDGFFLQPRIVGKNAELHPLLVLLALLVGAQFGLGGLVIAVPLAIMVRVAMKELWWDPMERQEYENKRLAAERTRSDLVAAGAVPMDMGVSTAVQRSAERSAELEAKWAESEVETIKPGAVSMARAEHISPDDIGDMAGRLPGGEEAPADAEADVETESEAPSVQPARSKRRRRRR